MPPRSVGTSSIPRVASASVGLRRTARSRFQDSSPSSGESTKPTPDEGPDFARGERTKTTPDEAPDFARGERTKPTPDEGPDFARGERKTDD